MLGRATYPASQIAACRAAMTSLCAAWREISDRSAPKARAEAETQVFNQMVVALEGWFVHRLRGVEGKDGNALNEVRLLAQGITTHGGWFPSDPTIKWRPEASMTGSVPGDRIALTEATFLRLTHAYLDAMAAKFSES